MLSGRPLLNNAPDAALLVDRPTELASLKSAVRAGFNMLLTGPTGSGRTTTIHALARTLASAPRRRERRTLAYARVEGATSAAAVLDAVTAAVTGEPATVSAGTDAALAALADALVEHERAPLLVVDDIAGSVGHTVFGTARDLLWELPARWLVATRSPQVSALLEPPADAFFEAHIELPALTLQQGSELIARRAPEVGVDWIPAVLDSTSGTPRTLLDAARALAGGLGADALVGDARARAAALAALGRPAQQMATALEALGAASASDAELLGMLALSRARAVQVLGQLESAAIVEAESVSTGRGHPRKVYRLTGAART